MSMTSAEFKAAIACDLAWASKLTDEVVILDFCDMRKSRITHLSPLLKFAGANVFGNSADFRMCKSLEVAEGVFENGVIFDKSGVVRIGDLTILNANDNGQAASFAGCKKLKVAMGTYPGSIDFSDSGIIQIGSIIFPSTDCTCNVSGCSKLTACSEHVLADGRYLMDDSVRLALERRLAARKALKPSVDLEL